MVKFYFSEPEIIDFFFAVFVVFNAYTVLIGRIIDRSQCGTK